jgi:hypothetical protein
MSTASTADLPTNEIPYPKATTTLQYDDTPWDEIETLEHLILECFHNKLGQMGTLDRDNGVDQWVFHFTAADIASVSSWPKNIVTNPILNDAEEIWVFCTFTEDEQPEEEWL